MNLMEKYQRKVKEPEAIRWDTLSHIHLSTARGLVGVDFRVTSPAITQAEAELNKVWLDCLHGRATVDDFN